MSKNNAIPITLDNNDLIKMSVIKHWLNIDDDSILFKFCINKVINLIYEEKFVNEVVEDV